ncbi:MAG: hypothetical protein ACI4B5_04855 [Bacteroidaceae bacterium]
MNHIRIFLILTPWALLYLFGGKTLAQSLFVSTPHTLLTNGQRERKVLFNSWEDVYFSVNEEHMHVMMDNAVATDCELFVIS